MLFTNIAKFTPWVLEEIQKTENANSFDSVFNRFDESGPQDVQSNIVNAKCTFRNSG